MYWHFLSVIAEGCGDLAVNLYIGFVVDGLNECGFYELLLDIYGNGFFLCNMFNVQCDT